MPKVQLPALYIVMVVYILQSYYSAALRSSRFSLTLVEVPGYLRLEVPSQSKSNKTKQSYSKLKGRSRCSSGIVHLLDTHAALT